MGTVQTNRLEREAKTRHEGTVMYGSIPLGEGRLFVVIC